MNSYSPDGQSRSAAVSVDDDDRADLFTREVRRVRVTGQHGRLQPPQFPAGFDAELLD
jgi:hypothetical protein